LNARGSEKGKDVMPFGISVTKEYGTRIIVIILKKPKGGFGEKVAIVEVSRQERGMARFVISRGLRIANNC
jgi:hypothetical protein